MFRKFLFSVPYYIRWLILICYLALVAFASLTPPRSIPRIISIPHIDKIVHFAMYLGFCIIAAWAMQRKNNNTIWLYPMVLLFAFLWGYSMELGQQLMSVGRNYSNFDMLANTLGAITGTLMYFFTIGRKPSNA